MQRDVEPSPLPRQNFRSYQCFAYLVYFCIQNIKVQCKDGGLSPAMDDEALSVASAIEIYNRRITEIFSKQWTNSYSWIHFYFLYICTCMCDYIRDNCIGGTVASLLQRSIQDTHATYLPVFQAFHTISIRHSYGEWMTELISSKVLLLLWANRICAACHPITTWYPVGQWNLAILTVHNIMPFSHLFVQNLFMILHAKTNVF